MVLYMTFDMYLFQVLPLLPWTYEFSKIMIIMYFGHRFPLTSHIRGHMLSTQMALLCPSADITHVGTQKDKLGLKWPKHYRCAWHLIHYPKTNLIYFYSDFWVAYATICIATRVSYASICIATRIYLHTWVPFKELACHTWVAYINARVYPTSILKNIIRY